MNTLDSLFSLFTLATVRGALLALAVLAIQAALRKRMPARWRYALWLPVILVCTSPILPRSRWSVENRFASSVNAAPLPLPLSESKPPDRAFSEVATALITERHALFADWRRLAAVIWLGGTAGLCLVAFTAYARTMRRIRRVIVPADPALVTLLSETAMAAGLQRPPRLLVSEAVPSPAVTGFLGPVLLLPADFPGAFTREEARLVLLHELMHLKRRDLPVNWLICLLQAIHWCNPMLWFAFSRMRADREAACDAQVLAATPEDRRADYGHALLKLEGGIGHPGLSLGFLGIFEHSAGMRSRIRAIAAHRRRHPAWGLLALTLIAGLTLGGATRAQTPPPRIVAPLPQANAELLRKLTTITIPRLELRDASVREVFEFLQKKSVEFDPSKKGVKIVLKLDPAGGSVPLPKTGSLASALKPEEPSITVSLSNIPLIQALKYVTGLANLEFRLEGNSVVVMPVGPPERLITREWMLTPSMHSALENKTGTELKDFLITRGLSFPEGAAVTLMLEGRRLIMRNSLEQLDRVEGLIIPPGPGRMLGAEILEGGAANRIQTKLSTIIIPRLEFRGATIREAVDFLKRKSVDLDVSEPDPAKRGVNFVLRLSPGPEAISNPRVTVSLTNIPLGEALRQVTGQANLICRVEEQAVAISPGGVDSAAKTDEPALPVDANSSHPEGAQIKATSIIIPSLQFREASLGEAIEFLRKKSVALDPEGKGVNFNSTLGPATAPKKITVSLTNISLWEAARYVAELTDTEISADPNALNIRPKDPSKNTGVSTPRR